MPASSKVPDLPRSRTMAAKGNPVEQVTIYIDLEDQIAKDPNFGQWITIFIRILQAMIDLTQENPSVPPLVKWTGRKVRRYAKERLKKRKERELWKKN
ncbi:hypothetical protein ACTXT7_009609 [Hymenolepis weldensis]